MYQYESPRKTCRVWSLGMYQLTCIRYDAETYTLKMLPYLINAHTDRFVITLMARVVYYVDPFKKHHPLSHSKACFFL